MRIVWKVLALIVAVSLIIHFPARSEPVTFDAAHLNVDMPFGVNWDMSRSDLANLSKRIEQSCIENPDHDTLGRREKIRLCKPRKRRGWTLPEFRSLEQRSSVQLGWQKGWKPATVTYSYQYYLGLPDHSVQMRWNRRARIIRDMLFRQYGPSLMRGGLKSYLTYELRPSDDGPCYFWLVQETAIALCRIRNIEIDAFDMSLSFIRLDRIRNGRAILETLSAVQRDQSAMVAAASDYIQEQNRLADATRFAEELEHLRSGMPYRKWCDVAKYGSIDDVPEPSELKAIPLLVDALSRFEGDALSEFAIEFSKTDQEFSVEKRDEIVFSLFVHAYREGSLLAAAEIGSDHLGCWFGMKQNFAEAERYSREALAINDGAALLLLAKMQMAGLAMDGGRVEGLATLKTCAATGYERCEIALSRYEILVENGEIESMGPTFLQQITNNQP